ncbi:MAG: High-affinity nickel-transporter [Actinobacteria bacterium]|nr:High-affinity nickel-transporter [Actinomycetota bacterium]
MRRRLLPLLLLVGCSWSIAAAAFAHPLGNFTSNTFTRVTVGASGFELTYVLDLAELPTVQARQRLDADADGEISFAESTTYAEERCGELADGLVLTTDAVPVQILTNRASLTFPEGQAGLPTLRLTCDLTAPASIATGTEVGFEDTNQPGRIGWREVVADGPLLASADVPAESVSDELRAYPEDRAPLDVTTATLTVGDAETRDPLAGFAPTGGIQALERATDGLSELMGRQQLTAGFVLLATLIAVVLGASHALAPGHGKTVMAAYLVSREGTLGQMLGLGTTVAVTHTLGVLLLGLLVTASAAFAPERLYPWLGVVSGVLFAAVGAWLLLRARRGGAGHDHGHTHDHGHGHDHGHDHGHTHDHAAPGPLGWRSLVLPGLAGGMLPSPSALVVLVAGIALGRFGFGLLLVLAYGVGMALTLLLAGLLLVRLRTRLLDRLDTSGRWAWVTQRLPTVTASLVIAGGILIAGRAALSI